MVFQQKLLENADFIFKLTGTAMVRPASSDKWKEPRESQLHVRTPLRAQKKDLSGSMGQAD